MEYKGRKFIEAFMDGKKVEFKSYELGWRPENSLAEIQESINEDYELRIVEPVTVVHEFWTNYYENGTSGLPFRTFEANKKYSSTKRKLFTFKVQVMSDGTFNTEIINK